MFLYIKQKVISLMDGVDLSVAYLLTQHKAMTRQAWYRIETTHPCHIIKMLAVFAKLTQNLYIK